MTKRRILKVFITSSDEDKNKLIKIAKAINDDRGVLEPSNKLMLLSTEAGATLINKPEIIGHIPNDTVYTVVHITIDDINQMLLEITFDNSNLY